MTRDQVMTVLPKMFDAFSSDETKAKLEAAGGDLGKLLGVIMEIQGGILVAEGIEPMAGLTALGKLEQDFAEDAEIQGLMAKFKAKVEEAKKAGG